VATLVEQLLSTDDALSRRAYFDGIVAMDVGSVHLFEALKDSRWFVVRNAAALLGEMGVEHADDTLIPLLRHADERIRIAVARALIRLRTIKAMQALHAMIDDVNAEVRRLSAAAFGLSGATVGGGVRPPAARLSSALERELDDDVALDMTGAPSGEVRDAWVRIAALEALVKARGIQMVPVIDSLMNDGDGEVAAAAAGLRAVAAAKRE
jgi:HEAT repeat protein